MAMEHPPYYTYTYICIQMLFPIQTSIFYILVGAFEHVLCVQKNMAMVVILHFIIPTDSFFLRGWLKPPDQPGLIIQTFAGESAPSLPLRGSAGAWGVNAHEAATIPRTSRG